MEYTAIILAGGKGSRFGGDKTQLEIKGVRIMDMMAEKCRPIFSEILIAGGKRTFDIPGVRSIPDIYQDMGPLGGIHACLSAASNEVCFVTACDMPNFHLPLVIKLLEASGGHDLVTPGTGESIQPLFSVYKKSILPQVEQMLSQNMRSVKRLFDIVGFYSVDMPLFEKKPEDDIFFNINRREDYEMIKGTVSPHSAHSIP